MRALSIAATGMQAQQTRVEVISNNLANMGTTAYKPRRAEFADLIYQQPRVAGEINAADGTVLPGGIQLGMGVRMVSVGYDMIQGSLLQTSGELDLAIQGGGWFEIELPTGETAYTRDGNFKRNADGQMVTSEGYVLQPEIVIPDETVKIAINAQGEVYASFQNQVEQQLLGAITLADFANDRGLEPIGGNLHLETEASGPANIGEPGADGRGALRQGYVEESAVDAVREITELIGAQRGYELNSKVITAADQMLAATVQVR
ncbi:flagellar basal-body rod protein FlgG [Rubrimonas cliftonensis]|uniref:Flagellar basal-body rod protein FlgG n=1 Tax=Rubrimonas cliftonensis TaxID=89524 RepID=A0A1H4C7Q1_9RHOB|nr:flagellar basal-body rod protein FlgG [Rubrimonas cliftonensis]SEA56112.1 flagellar basal-body rod protein FlgG [Rubrimonas cliftonensis]